jgi:predicted NodU family carbamoyl transferase
MIFIAIQSGHNATVGLSKNGELVALISEERITRQKNFAGFPSESLRYVKSKYLNNDFSVVDRFIFVGDTGQVLIFVNNKISKNKINSQKNLVEIKRNTYGLIFYIICSHILLLIILVK